MWRHRCEIGTKVRTPSLQLMQLSDCVSLRSVENRASIVAFLRARFRILGELFIAPTQLRRARNVPKIPPFVKILIGTFLPATRPRYLHIRRANIPQSRRVSSRRRVRARRRRLHFSHRALKLPFAGVARQDFEELPELNNTMC
jgi:hypothetical protein